MKRHSRFQLSLIFFFISLSEKFYLIILQTKEINYRSQNGNNPVRDVERTRVKGKKHLIKKYLVEYLTNSNLHGLKYVGEKERTPIEKYFWFIVFTCSAVLCGYFIRNLYIKWDKSPVIVSFAENTTPTWQIPFPAVTVCFETKSLQTQFNFTEYYHIYMNETAYAELTEDKRRMYEDTTLVCNNRLITPVEDLNVSDVKTTIQNIKQVAPKISDFMFSCYWRGLLASCERIFSPILIGDGLCYTFNILGAQELFRLENMHKEYEHLECNKSAQAWSVEDGYDSSAPLETYPQRSLGNGIQAGLMVTFGVSNTDLDYVCKMASQGYKIILHNPANLPQSNKQYYHVPLSQEVNLVVKPIVMTTSDGLKSYSISQRKCYFQNQRYLRYFKVYTQDNCAMECMTNFTYVRCGCVHFGMPHAPDMPVCSASSLQCLWMATVNLVKAAIQSDNYTSENDSSDEEYTVASQCNCLPACTSIQYEADISQAYFNYQAVGKAYGWQFENMKNYQFSTVKIFFEDTQFIASRRSELYGRIDFLANCGGVLGLCMGFSILSVAEIIYFLTLRIVMWRRRYLEQNKAICE